MKAARLPCFAVVSFFGFALLLPATATPQPRQPPITTRTPIIAPGDSTSPYRVRGVVLGYRYGNTRLTQPSWKQISADLDSQVIRLRADRIAGLVTGTKDERYDIFVKWAVGVGVSPDTGRQARGSYDPQILLWSPMAFADSLQRSPKNRSQFEERTLRITRIALAEKGYYVTESETDARQLASGGSARSDPGRATDSMSIVRLHVETIRPGTRFRAWLSEPGARYSLWESSDSSTAVGAGAGRKFVFGGTAANAEAVDVIFTHLPKPRDMRDTDGDHVPNYRDKEPGTPLGAEVTIIGEAIDEDGDGVPNGLDQDNHTQIGALVGDDGVARDEDSDGVPNGIDQCEGTSARLRVDARGCPIEVTEIETRLLSARKIVENRLMFATGSARLLPASHALLDTIGRGLSDLPRIRFEVQGHCDERGSDEVNLRLSESRAKSVVDYLVGRFPGLRREQLTVRGYGRSVPVDTLSTPEGWARNRRVEFEVLNPDSLKEQIEIRRQLERGEPAPATTGR